MKTESLVKELNLSGAVQAVTYEQVQIKYKSLAKKYAYFYSVPGVIEFDDLLQCCYIAMWKCFNKYILPYNFPTVAKTWIKWEVSNYKKMIYKQKRLVISLESAVCTSNKDGSEVLLIDTLGEEDDNIERLPDTEISRKLLESLNPRQRDQITSLFLDDEKRCEIAKKYNMNNAQFKKESIKTINRFRKLFVYEEYGG